MNSSHKLVSIFLFSVCVVLSPAQIEVVSGGNVGIGTASPTAKLEINSAGSGATTLSVTGGMLGGPTAAVLTNYPAVTANGTNYTRNLGFYSWSLPIASGITDSGYRIGLDIENFVSDSSFLGTLTAQYGLWARVGSYSAGNGTIQNSYGVYIENLDGPATISNKFGLYQANATAKNYFAGNVGVGTASPGFGGSLLQVQKDQNATTRMLVKNDDSGASSATEFVVNAYGNSWALGMGSTANNANAFYIGKDISGGTPVAKYLSITTSGNVGIGTTAPGYKLEVAGSVRATSFISNSTTYADFVFKPGYQLPSLAETEAAIQRDGHLPGIPSEAEATAHGIDLSAMQVKLLQKVEELTLHQIAQEKRLNAQAARIASLEDENRRLRTR